MFNKVLTKYSHIIGAILTLVVMVSAGTISTFNNYEPQMPDCLVPKDDE